MKHNVIFVDHNNRKQVNWWNRVASNLVTVEYRQTMYDTITGKPYRTRLHIKGPLAGYVATINATFNPK